MKPFSGSCEQNREPILDVLKIELAGKKRLLEIGSGTGQHAVYFAAEFPALVWQTSEVADNHSGIQQWLDEYAIDNILPPVPLNVSHDAWPTTHYDATFSANTVHIMAWPDVENLFTGVGQCLQPGGVFCLYGPFNYDGAYTSASNEKFDGWLKSRNPLSGIRDFEAVDALAEKIGLRLKKDYTMPANNRLLVWTS
ncbi:MAG: DUF938 domain-containing protein [Gammaproteobacteria bacterium]